MVNNKIIYWEKRRLLLDAIMKNGLNLPLSVLSRKIVSCGASLNLIMNDLVDNKYIIKLNISNRVSTRLTDKGKRLLYALNNLSEVLNEN